MARSARLPMAEFRSLLLAPVRIRLQTLHSFARSFARPICARGAAPAATCTMQRRSLHLYKTARAETALGMHKVLDFNRYEFAAPSESRHRVNLVRPARNKGQPAEMIAEDISLQELYDTHVSPGNMIYLVDEIPKKFDGNYEALRDQRIPATCNNYAICPALSTGTVTVKGAQRHLKQYGAAKNVVCLVTNPPEYRRRVLDRAYQQIELGSPIEFRIRLFASAMATNHKGKTIDPSAVPWLHAHFPHLRPDFILKSMPERSVYLIRPVTDGRMIQFVVGREAEENAGMNLTTRLFRVKGEVARTLHKNAMAQRAAHNKLKSAAGQIRDENGWRQITDEEKAEQETILEDAKTGRRGKLTIRHLAVDKGKVVEGVGKGGVVEGVDKGGVDNGKVGRAGTEASSSGGTEASSSGGTEAS